MKTEERPENDIYVQCCRCRNKHWESERLKVPDKKFSFVSNLVCPRCKAASFYRLDEEAA